MMVSSTTCKGKEGGGRKRVRACVRAVVCKREREPMSRHRTVKWQRRR